jgi:hypothetical protein
MSPEAAACQSSPSPGALAREESRKIGEKSPGCMIPNPSRTLDRRIRSVLPSSRERSSPQTVSTAFVPSRVTGQ